MIMFPRVKVCGITNTADLDAALEAGVDAVGFLVGQVHPSPDFIPPEAARGLIESVPPFVTTVLVTHEENPDAIIAIASRVRASSVQLHSDLEPEALASVRSRLNRFIIGKVTVEDGSSIDRALRIASTVDALLLDSANRATGQVGGTGLTHDWAVSAQIRRRCPRPVILAGGLRPTNVHDAVATVRPAAVDVNSGVEDETGRKSSSLIRSFISATRGTWTQKP
jgi:phosphoribosylanthranilate isomerase